MFRQRNKSALAQIFQLFFGGRHGYHISHSLIHLNLSKNCLNWKSFFTEDDVFQWLQYLFQGLEIILPPPFIPSITLITNNKPSSSLYQIPGLWSSSYQKKNPTTVKNAQPIIFKVSFIIIKNFVSKLYKTKGILPKPKHCAKILKKLLHFLLNIILSAKEIFYSRKLRLIVLIFINY